MVKGLILGTAATLMAVGQVASAAAATPAGIASNRAALGIVGKDASGQRVQTDVRTGASRLQDSAVVVDNGDRTATVRYGGVSYIVALAAVAAFIAGLIAAASHTSTRPRSPG